MKRTRELTATHYRRSIKRSASPDLQNIDPQRRCPVCGALLSTSPVKKSEEKEGVKVAHVCSIARKNGAK